MIKKILLHIYIEKLILFLIYIDVIKIYLYINILYNIIMFYKILTKNYMKLSLYLLVINCIPLNLSKDDKMYDFGEASFYSSRFQGKQTASGEIFDMNKLTAASNFYKLGTKVRVTNIKNGKKVIVKVNDRMNKKNKRLIDLSLKAAKNIGIKETGIGRVRIETIF